MAARSPWLARSVNAVNWAVVIFALDRFFPDTPFPPLAPMIVIPSGSHFGAVDDIDQFVDSVTRSLALGQPGRLLRPMLSRLITQLANLGRLAGRFASESPIAEILAHEFAIVPPRASEVVVVGTGTRIPSHFSVSRRDIDPGKNEMISLSIASGQKVSVRFGRLVRCHTPGNRVQLEVLLSCLRHKVKP